MQAFRHQGILIPILSSGRGWMAVEKPAGLSVHNDPLLDLVSIVTSQIKRHPSLSERIARGRRTVFRPVHRLDKLTSGVILLACDAAALKYLGDQFQLRDTDKRYLALLHGCFSRVGETGAWKRPLSQQAGGRDRPAGTGPKKASLTRYRVLAHSPHYTYLECRPVTGRKHQIRRHAKLAGHPVVGDRRYGSKRAADFLTFRKGFSRLGLHANTLKIREPWKEQTVRIRSVGLPPEMEKLFREDRFDGKRP